MTPSRTVRDRQITGNMASGFDDTVAGGDAVTCDAPSPVVCGEGTITAADDQIPDGIR